VAQIVGAFEHHPGDVDPVASAAVIRGGLAGGEKRAKPPSEAGDDHQCGQALQAQRPDAGQVGDGRTGGDTGDRALRLGHPAQDERVLKMGDASRLGHGPHETGGKGLVDAAHEEIGDHRPQRTDDLDEDVHHRGHEEGEAHPPTGSRRHARSDRSGNGAGQGSRSQTEGGRQEPGDEYERAGADSQRAADGGAAADEVERRRRGAASRRAGRAPHGRRVLPLPRVLGREFPGASTSTHGPDSRIAGRSTTQSCPMMRQRRRGPLRSRTIGVQNAEPWASDTGRSACRRFQEASRPSPGRFGADEAIT